MIHIFGGGTISHIRSHLALCAPSYGNTAQHLYSLCRSYFREDPKLYLSKMASMSGEFETYEDLEELLEEVVEDESTKIIFMNAAVVDFKGEIVDDPIPSGKYSQRLSSRKEPPKIQLSPYPKLLKTIRKDRKDIFLVAFKTTTNFDEDQQYIAGLNLCKETSANLVFCNDVVTRRNIIVTPEEARYTDEDVLKSRGEEWYFVRGIAEDNPFVSKGSWTYQGMGGKVKVKDIKELDIDLYRAVGREFLLQELVNITHHRSQLTFTRTTVVDGNLVPWDSDLIPNSLRKVVDWCVANKAYKPFRNVTSGHFAFKLDDNTFLSSIRKTNFNNETNLVKVITEGPDKVLAYGVKPSAGGQTQRIIFQDNPEYDCIVHFHCPLKNGSKVNSVSQKEHECGSHECGINTSKGLVKFGNLSAVHLDNHGPNIVFHHSINPDEVIRFIDENFDLSQKTGGRVDYV